MYQEEEHEVESSLRNKACTSVANRMPVTTPRAFVQVRRVEPCYVVRVWGHTNKAKGNAISRLVSPAVIPSASACYLRDQVTDLCSRYISAAVWSCDAVKERPQGRFSQRQVSGNFNISTSLNYRICIIYKLVESRSGRQGSLGNRKSGHDKRVRSLLRKEKILKNNKQLWSYIFRLIWFWIRYHFRIFYILMFYTEIHLRVSVTSSLGTSLRPLNSSKELPHIYPPGGS